MVTVRQLKSGTAVRLEREGEGGEDLGARGLTCMFSLPVAVGQITDTNVSPSRSWTVLVGSGSSGSIVTERTPIAPRMC